MTPSSTGRAQCRSWECRPACQYLELDIWDEHGTSLPAGERGEVVLRGRRCSRATGAIRRDEHGVRGRLVPHRRHRREDDDGYLYIVDRLKDMIVSGGENIASSEVERCCTRRVVLEPPSSAVPTIAGERSRCLRRVELAGDDDTRGAHRALPATAREFKVPKQVVLVDALPRNPSGKVLNESSGTGAVLRALQPQVRHEGGRPAHEVGRDVVARLVVDLRPVLRDVLDRRLGCRVDVPLGRAMKMRAKRPAPAA